MEYGGKFMYQIRTDLALETQEKMQEDHVDLKGVRFLEEKVDKNITVSTVVIETENGAKTMGKPKGTYITIEAGNMDEEDEDYHREISVQLAKIIRQLIQEKNEELSVLVVGLGNREVTPDALGPRVVDNLFITRHIVKEYGKYAFGEKNVNRISSIVPGVMAQTGMESLEIIHGIIDETKPDLVIAFNVSVAPFFIPAFVLFNVIFLTFTSFFSVSGFFSVSFSGAFLISPSFTVPNTSGLDHPIPVSSFQLNVPILLPLASASLI